MATVSHLPHVIANALVREAAARCGRGVGAPARGRPELSRHDPRRRRQPGDLGRHLRHQPRGGRGEVEAIVGAARRGRRADPRRRPPRGRPTGIARLARTADACSRRTWPGASCASSGSRSRTGRGRWPRLRSPSGAQASTSRTWPSIRLPTCAPARSPCGWRATEEAERASRIVRGLGHSVSVSA